MKSKTVLVQKFVKKAVSKKLSKYIAVVDYMNKTLIVSYATNGGISIISFKSAIGVPIGVKRVAFTLVFSLATAIINKLFKITNKKNIE